MRGLAWIAVAFTVGCTSSKEPDVNEIPESEAALLVRTDFSDDEAWRAICTAIRKPAGPFKAFVAFRSDPVNEGLTPDRIQTILPKDTFHSFVFIVDRIAIAGADHPILVVDLYGERGRTFRVIPSEMATVENNLSIANMDFEDFIKALDRDGVFRGFR